MNVNPIDLVQTQINIIDTLLQSLDSVQLREWRESTLMILDQIISEESKYYKNFANISFTSNILSMSNPEKNKRRNEESMKLGLENARASLKAIIFGLERDLL